MEKKKLNKELKGWQIFIVAIIFFTTGIALDNLVGSFMVLGGNIFMLIAIVTGVTNLIKKRKQVKA